LKKGYAMRTIIHALGLEDLVSDGRSLFEDIEAEAANCRRVGDFLGAGEWIGCKLLIDSLEQDKVSEAIGTMIILWAASSEPPSLPSSAAEAKECIGDYPAESVATSLVAVLAYLRQTTHAQPEGLTDLAFRVRQQLQTVFDLSEDRPAELCRQAVARYSEVYARLLTSLSAFTRTNGMTAKVGSLHLLRDVHDFKKLAPVAERAILDIVDILLGPAFRKFCESCEKQESRSIIDRAKSLRTPLQEYDRKAAPHRDAAVWHNVVLPAIRHVTTLLDRETRATEVATSPALLLDDHVSKADLSIPQKRIPVMCSVRNAGNGRALNISMTSTDSTIQFAVLEPPDPFDLDGESSQLLTTQVILAREHESVAIPLEVNCSTIAGRKLSFNTVLRLEQQLVQPRWDSLAADPPYTINPVQAKEKLFGRDSILNSLLLNAAGGTSTFLWGQKRIGKTSIVQVFAREAERQSRSQVLLFRMGELSGLHEGQIAHRIATRLLERCPHSSLAFPAESDFGGSLGTLVPFCERFLNTTRNKYVIAIDEFDDFPSALYTGERGRLFVKALRSLSELGLSFVFVGSERMEAIYQRHQEDLNKWVNLSLDKISSRLDCRLLVTKPLEGSIEYQIEAVDFIIDYCANNPFYIHLLCRAMFERCYNERRTYVDEALLRGVLDEWIRTLTPSMFAHLWEDNPELDEVSKDTQAAENCLVLACLSLTGGVCAGVDEVDEAQTRLDIGPQDRLSRSRLRSAMDRLCRRGVLKEEGDLGPYELYMPVFRRWLSENGRRHCINHWREHCRRVLAHGQGPGELVRVEAAESFPIEEEHLLNLSSRLVFRGKQKDVVELKVWMRQFDDQNRIELAYILLKRLVEKGFISDGARQAALEKAQDIISALRADIGGHTWKVFRGKKDNLCIAYVDSETKSGAAVCRELSKRVGAGKSGRVDSIIPWMESHRSEDPMVVIVDDFVGTGSTVERGLGAFMATKGRTDIIRYYASEGRVICVPLYGFAEGIDNIKGRYTSIRCVPANCFGDEVRALAHGGDLFTDERERQFAEHVLLQIGRELVREHPLGFGDMGALVCFSDNAPNNTLPIFWSAGRVGEKQWNPLFPRV
jgi:hypothetical protein